MLTQDINTFPPIMTVRGTKSIFGSALSPKIQLNSHIVCLLDSITAVTENFNNGVINRYRNGRKL